MSLAYLITNATIDLTVIWYNLKSNSKSTMIFENVSLLLQHNNVNNIAILET